MPSPPTQAPRLIQFTRFGRKPAKARLPGLDTHGLLCGRLGPGRFVWRFFLEGLYCN